MSQTILRSNLKLYIISSIVYISGFTLGFAQLGSTKDLQVFRELSVIAILKINFLNILKNNILMIIYELLGAMTFGSSTLINLFLNGYVLAIYIKISYYYIHDYPNIILLVLPHGIFEIPAIIIAGAAGFKIPYEIIRYLTGKKEQILTKEDIKEYLTLALI